MEIKITPKMLARELEIMSEAELSEMICLLSKTKIKILKKYIKGELKNRKDALVMHLRSKMH